MNTISRKLVIANTIGLIVVLVINFLSNSLPLNGKTPGQLSDQYPNLFTPAGLTFSIWGIIYLGLILWVGYQVVALFNQKAAAKVAPMLDKIGWLFAYTCLLNIGWLFAWYWEQILLSVVVMANLLYFLVQLNRAAEVGQSASSTQEKWLEHLPLGIYQGWITVALIANVTAFLVSQQWSGLGISETNWAIALISTGALLGVFMVLKRNNLGHGLAVSWALYGIYLKRSTSLDEGSETVAMIALAFTVLVLVTMLLRVRKWLAY
jgi:hypothetical protein